MPNVTLHAVLITTIPLGFDLRLNRSLAIKELLHILYVEELELLGVNVWIICTMLD